MRENIRIFLKEQRLKQIDLAEELGVKPATISGMLSGKSLPTVPQMIYIAEKYNVDLNWLLRGIGEMYLPDPVEEAMKKLEKDRLGTKLEDLKLEQNELIKDMIKRIGVLEKDRGS